MEGEKKEEEEEVDVWISNVDCGGVICMSLSLSLCVISFSDS